MKKQQPFDALARVGVHFPPHTQRRLTALVEQDRIAEAQRSILDLLALEFDGPPFRVSMQPGQRKRLVPR